ncbi:MAG: universal stress protein [Solirubrobacterales bacterium]
MLHRRLGFLQPGDGPQAVGRGELGGWARDGRGDRCRRRRAPFDPEDPRPVRHRQGWVAALARAVEVARERHATIDLCAVARPGRSLYSFAVLAGYLPQQLEADEIAKLAGAVRASVTTVPANVGIRSLLLVGDPPRLIKGLARDGGYDLVVISSPGRAARSRRALVRRLLGLVDLLIVPV